MPNSQRQKDASAQQSTLRNSQMPFKTSVLMENSRQSKQQHSRSLNASYELPVQPSSKKAKAQILTDRSGSVQPYQQDNKLQTGESFQIQRESLNNLQNEDYEEILRDKIPQPYQEYTDKQTNPLLYDDQNEDISPINQDDNLNNIDALDFDIQIKSLVQRIKKHAQVIQEKVKVHKDLSQSFVLLQQDDEYDNTDIDTKDLHVTVDNGLDVSAISQRPQNDKSQSFILDNSYIMNHATAQFNMLGNDNQVFDGSLLLSPTHKDGIKIYEVNSNDLTIDNVEKQNEEIITIQKDLLVKILNDLKSKNEAEIHSLQQELKVFKRALQVISQKYRNLQIKLNDENIMGIENYKIRHQNEKLKAQNQKLRNENKNLQNKLDITRMIMFEYDMKNIEEQNADNVIVSLAFQKILQYLIDQLVRENHHLQRLLLISDTFGQKDFSSIEEQLRFLENQTVNMMSQPTDPVQESRFGTNRKNSNIGYYSNKKLRQLEKSPQPFTIPEPLNQNMPGEVKMHIKDRQLMKEEERRVKQEMRMIAEEEILRELRMAQEYFLSSSDFQKTGKLMQLQGHSQQSPSHMDERDEEDDFDRAQDESYEKQMSRQREHSNAVYNTPEKRREEDIETQQETQQQYESQNEGTPENVFTQSQIQEDENKVGNEQR